MTHSPPPDPEDPDEPQPSPEPDPGVHGWHQLAPDWDPATRTADADAHAAATLDEANRTAQRVSHGGIRAAVLGVNDGLVTNLCLILGIAGASADSATVRLAGLASLLAGALSMAAGEWVSVRSQVEVAESMERALHRAWLLSPPTVLGRLSARMQGGGLDRPTAQRASRSLLAAGMRTRNSQVWVLYGVTPGDVGSPLVAAVYSLLLFVVGAFVPLLPWFLTSGGAALAGSMVLTGLASLGVGGVLGWQAGRAVWTAVRQLLIVTAASAVTYLIGELAGTTVA
ncbi:VIT1/CCC1 transporter family protein [Streptomyces xiaopingdaonensis]|uniref:VIT1/CCC1 transporter family protein n=1 Tax=Streptomyces xiaopingdaonensis TaxID=1565415 RepID=UPI00030CC70E|nr:VIT1/CCC1 transporter family protein [Streptomyces xiaopingdaonensis]